MAVCVSVTFMLSVITLASRLLLALTWRHFYWGILLMLLLTLASILASAHARRAHGHA